MKRKYFIKKTGICIAITAMMSSLLLNSCKDNSPGSVDFSKSPALVGWQYSGFAATPYSAVMLPTGTFTENMEVTLSVPSVTLGSAVTVHIAEDDSLVPSDHIALPTSLYSFGATTITIPAGQQTVKFPVVFKAGQIDFTKNYAVAFKITSADGALVASNLNEAVVELQVKSLYEGNYNVKGFVLRLVGGVPDQTLGGYFSGYTQYLSTIGAYTVTWAPLWKNGTAAAGVDGTTITVDPATNKVTMASSTNSSLGNAAGYNNRYDPSTHTFYISYTWSSGNRAETDTLTLK